MNVLIPKFNSITYGKSSLRYMGPFYWNKLPNDVKQAASFKLFKKALKCWMPTCSCNVCILCKVMNM